MERTKKEIDMDYEKKYKEALKDMRVIYPNLKGDAKLAVEHAFPELAESEDERIRKKLIWQVQMNVEDETADLQKSVYNGVKGHDPDLEESIEDWKKCLAWLEKQKEQKDWAEELNTKIKELHKQCIATIAEQKEPIDPFDTKLFQDGVKEGRRLERKDIKKEPIPIPDKFSGLKSLMLQYLHSAANRTDDTEIESDTDLFGRKILDYVWKHDEKQKESLHIHETRKENANSFIDEEEQK